MDQNNQGYVRCPEGDENEEARGVQWEHVAGHEDTAHWPPQSYAASGSGVSEGTNHAYFPETGTPNQYLIPVAQPSVSSWYTQTPQGHMPDADNVNPYQDGSEVVGTQQLESHSTGYYPPQPHDIVQSTESYAPPPQFRDEHRYPTPFNNDIAGASSMSYSPSIPQPNTYSPAPNTPQSAANYTVACPYRCGVVLTGVHAVGNLTRHLKTKACVASGKAKVRYLCPIDGCTKEYSRSDGLRVHMRKQHGAPAANPKNGSPADDLNENDDDE